MKYLENMIKLEINRQRKNKMIDESEDEDDLSLEWDSCPKR